MSTGRLFAAVGAAVLGALAGAWPAWPVVALDVDGALVGHVPVEPGDRFGVTFRHSVDHLRVQDWYVVREGRIVQDATRMRQYGAGMGNTPSDGTGRAVAAWWEIDDMNRPIGDLVLRVGGREVDHRLHHPDGEVALSKCWPRQQVTVRATRISTLSRVLAALPGRRCDT